MVSSYLKKTIDTSFIIVFDLDLTVRVSCQVLEMPALHARSKALPAIMCLYFALVRQIVGLSASWAVHHVLIVLRPAGPLSIASLHLVSESVFPPTFCLCWAVHLFRHPPWSGSAMLYRHHQASHCVQRRERARESCTSRISAASFSLIRRHSCSSNCFPSFLGFQSWSYLTWQVSGETSKTSSSESLWFHWAWTLPISRYFGPILAGLSPLSRSNRRLRTIRCFQARRLTWWRRRNRWQWARRSGVGWKICDSKTRCNCWSRGSDGPYWARIDCRRSSDGSVRA